MLTFQTFHLTNIYWTSYIYDLIDLILIRILGSKGEKTNLRKKSSLNDAGRKPVFVSVYSWDKIEARLSLEMRCYHLVSVSAFLSSLLPSYALFPLIFLLLLFNLKPPPLPPRTRETPSSEKKLLNQIHNS